MKAWRLNNAKLSAAIKRTDDPEKKQSLESQKITKRQAQTRFTMVDKMPSPLLCGLLVKVGVMQAP